MKRYEYESAVYHSHADSATKAVLLYYGFRKNWKDDGKVWVSATTVANDTGFSVSTVNRRIPRLRDHGWLIATGRIVGNGAFEYDLAVGRHFSTEATSAATPAPVPETTATQTDTLVTMNTTPGTETDKEVSNKKDNNMKEEVRTDAEASVTDLSLVRKVRGNSKTSSNMGTWTGLSQKEILHRLYVEMDEEKQLGRAILEDEIRKLGLSKTDADAARRRFESSTFMPKEGTGKRAIHAVYWRPYDEDIHVSTGTWDDTW